MFPRAPLRRLAADAGAVRCGTHLIEQAEEDLLDFLRRVLVRAREILTHVCRARTLSRAVALHALRSCGSEVPVEARGGQSLSSQVRRCNVQIPPPDRKASPLRLEISSSVFHRCLVALGAKQRMSREARLLLHVCAELHFVAFIGAGIGKEALAGIDAAPASCARGVSAALGVPQDSPACEAACELVSRVTSRLDGLLELSSRRSVTPAVIRGALGDEDDQDDDLPQEEGGRRGALLLGKILRGTVPDLRVCQDAEHLLFRRALAAARRAEGK